MDYAKATVDNAARILALRALDYHEPEPVTLGQAREFVNDELVGAWFEVEVRNTTPATLFQEAFEDVTDVDCQRVLVTLLRGTDLTTHILREALTDHVAHYLRRKANEIVDREYQEPRAICWRRLAGGVR